ncbi:MAG: hypothetical protein K8R68_06810 [Bacteroidales bacterium]|nr:hypothetical protein [Bacteroidales bacterium]
MSEFTNNREKRIEELLKLFHAIMDNDDAVNAIKRNQNVIKAFQIHSYTKTNSISAFFTNHINN